MNKRPTLFEKIVICFSLLLLLVQEVKAQVLTTKQQDSAYLVNPTQERLRKIKKSIAKTFVRLLQFSVYFTISCKVFSFIV